MFTFCTNYLQRQSINNFETRGANDGLWELLYFVKLNCDVAKPRNSYQKFELYFSAPSYTYMPIYHFYFLSFFLQKLGEILHCQWAVYMRLISTFQFRKLTGRIISFNELSNSSGKRSFYWPVCGCYIPLGRTQKMRSTCCRLLRCLYNKGA